jgi:GTP diphosphokinase / guanosine-3',5'-bis(diphosphate) 3'-diphosphatase
MPNEKKRDDIKELIDEILKYNPNAKKAKIIQAFNFIKKAHSNQKRMSGESYFDHPFSVAKILTRLKAGSTTIIAALLHDIIEDTQYTFKDIENMFGEETASLVKGLTNIKKVHFKTKEEYKAENIRKILLASTKDVRIILIKLADRLHNMQTLSAFRIEKQKRIATETLEIYAPIADKLGIWWMKGELEDLALRFLEPEIYSFIRSRINEKRTEREKKTKEIIKKINDELTKRNIKAIVTGRAKYFFSIYKKMLKKNVTIDEIYDLIAVRIITNTIPNCYSALGVVHELWTPIPRRFKDYIANPKNNGYQSLHTSLKTQGPIKRIIEVQIRTEEEHNFAEDGIAAHWRYKGTERDKWFDKKISWLKQLLEWKHSSINSKEFIETLNLNLFEDEIVTFTPKGDPISLPEASTPVDFAYEVHTSIGEHCSKAKVNDKIVPLNTILKPGDIVEIITQKNASPSRQWLKFTSSNKARSKIKNFLHISVEADTRKKALAEMSIKKIKDLIDIEGKQYPIKISKCCSPKPVEPIVGFYTKDKKISVHKADCNNIYSFPESSKVLVFWKPQPKETFTIRVLLKEKEGILTKILNMFVSNNQILVSVNTKQRKEKKFMLILECEKTNQKELNTLIKKLKEMVDVVDITII